MNAISQILVTCISVAQPSSGTADADATIPAENGFIDAFSLGQMLPDGPVAANPDAPHHLGAVAMSETPTKTSKRKPDGPSIPDPSTGDPANWHAGMHAIAMWPSQLAGATAVPVWIIPTADADPVPPRGENYADTAVLPHWAAGADVAALADAQAADATGSGSLATKDAEKNPVATIVDPMADAATGDAESASVPFAVVPNAADQGQPKLYAPTTSERPPVDTALQNWPEPLSIKGVAEALHPAAYDAQAVRRGTLQTPETGGQSQTLSPRHAAHSARVMPSEKAAIKPPTSTVETTLRQIWQADTLDVPDESLPPMAAIQEPVSEDGIKPWLMVAALSAVAHQGKPGSETPKPSPGNRPAKPDMVTMKASTLKDPQMPLQMERAATLHHDAAQTKLNSATDAVLLGSTDIGVVSVALRPSASHGAGLVAAPPMQILPANVSPTIVEMAKSQDDGPLDLALAPEELGRLKISIKQEGTFVHVTLTAERPETLELMRRHGGDLVADLRQAGFSGASLSFGQGRQGDQPKSAGNAPDGNAHASRLPPAPDTKQTLPSRSQIGTGLDLRI